LGEEMNTVERKEIINQKLERIGETINSWSKKNGLDHRLVFDLIDGKLLGVRGISLKARLKIEECFGNIFDK
jgi:gp16 family phage-associated protein